MFEKLKAKILFNKLLQRPNIDKAYAMVSPSDSWYNTITKVHNSLREIKKIPHVYLGIKSHDGLILQGIYYPSENKSDITIICVHGYTSHAEREWAFPGLFYHSLGYNVLICYQRAHGLSEGKYITFGALEQLDMQKWIEEINKINPNGKIIIHGLSMGGGITLFLSNKNMENVKCLIADAPSISIKKFFKNVSEYAFKSKNEVICSHLYKRFNKEFNVVIDDYEGDEIIKSCRYPILLSAGSEEHLEEMFDILKQNNPNETDIIILPGCNHGNGMYKQTELYQDKIKRFIKKYI